MATDRRRTPPAAPRAGRRRATTRPARRARLTSRRTALGVWGRRRAARLPMGPILLVLAASLALVALRATPSDDALDPASASPVVVALVELPTGAVVDADDLEVRALPVVAVPPTSVSSPDEVVGRQVTAVILAGEPVVEARLAPDGLLGVAAATPPTWSSFALPSDASMPASVVGQSVDLYALDTAVGVGSTSDGARRVARGGRVVAIEDDHVTVAVPGADAGAVAAALIGSTVVLAVTGPAASGSVATPPAGP